MQLLKKHLLQWTPLTSFLTTLSQAIRLHSNPPMLLCKYHLAHSTLLHFMDCFPPLCLLSISLSLSLSPLSFPQRQAKYSENKLKCTKARNDYLLNLAATNAVVAKYYIHDVSDMIDVSMR